VTEPSYRLALLDEGFDLTEFDCGEPEYNTWLAKHARRAHELGSSRVYVLLECDSDGNERVVGYFAICPTTVVRATMPKPLRRDMLSSAPGWLLAKLAVDKSVRGSEHQLGRQLLREALETIADAAARGGGAVIVVDPDNEGLVGFYQRHGFKPTDGGDLRMFMKIATVRDTLGPGH
jgi:ribosomal protein S18 acetylase RimI-like enzyme